jgi:glycosyltransferase involved in cell wall biosynthesis
MKIMLDATASVSGGRVYLDHLLPQLARLAPEHEFIVCHTNERSPAWPQPAQSRFRYHRVSFPGAGSSVLKMLWRLFALPWPVWRIRPDVLFSNAGFGPLWIPQRTKLVIAIHNSMPLRDDLIPDERMTERWRLKMLRRLIGRSARRCVGVIVFSQDSAEALKRCFGNLKREPLVIPHGVDWGEAERTMSVDTQALSRRGISQPYVLFVSHLHRYKNALRLLEAFAAVAREHPRLSLVLAGEAADRNYWSEIESALARLGLTEKVKHVPGCSRAELKNICRGARAFVQPSLAETFSLPLAEAMAMGLPVAVARSSALPEVAGEAALYFDPHDSTEMAEAMRRLVSDDNLCAALSEQAIIQAQNFSWERSALLTLELLDEVMKQPEPQSVISRQPETFH